MRPSLENIHKFHLQLSPAQPILGSCNLHPAPGKPFWDMHYGLEFGLACSGKERRFFFDKTERVVTAGDIWFCGMWEPHGSRVIKAPCEVIVLTIWPPLLTQMHFPEAGDFHALAPFNAPPGQRPRTPQKMRATLIEFGRRLKRVLSAGAPHQTLKLRFIFQEMLLCIFEFWPEAAVSGRQAPVADFPQINRALQMVFDSRDFVSTSDAARACGMERHKFSALFQAWMNISFADFSARHRLHQAAMQLHNTKESLKAITRNWGFVDASHFHRLFLKHFGISPGEYRQRMFPRRNAD